MNRLNDDHRIREAFLFKSCLCVVLTCAPVLGYSHELKTTIGINTEYTDNSRQLPPPDELKELTVTPSLAINYKLEYPSAEANLRYRVARTDYRKDTFEDRTDFTGEGSLQWSIIDKRLSWNFYQNRNRLRIDSLNVDTPENETERNVMRTGPTFQLNFGRDGYLQLNAAYVDNSFDNGRITNSSQVQYGFASSQSVGARTKMGLTGRRSDIEFDNDQFNYKSDRIALNISGTGQSYKYDVNFGRNFIKRDSGEKNSGPFVSLSLGVTRGDSVWNFSANQELTDSATGLSLDSNVSNGLNNGDANFDSTDVVQRSRVEFSYTNQLIPDRLSASLNVAYDEQDFQTLPQDQRSEGAGVSVQLNLSRRMISSYRYNRSKEKLEAAPLSVNGEESVHEIHQIDFRYNVNPKLDIVLSFLHDQRDYEFGLRGIRDYKEFSSALSLEYQL